jgi:hypothetical protein
MLGKAVYDRHLIDVEFSLLFYKRLLAPRPSSSGGGSGGGSGR